MSLARAATIQGASLISKAEPTLAALASGCHAVEVLTRHAQPSIRTTPDKDSQSLPQQASTAQFVAPLVSLQGMLTEVSKMLDTILNYVKQVNEGAIQGDAKIGRYLLETLASVPMATSSKAQFEEDFNSHLAVGCYSCACIIGCWLTVSVFSYRAGRISSWSLTWPTLSVSTSRSGLAQTCCTTPGWLRVPHRLVGSWCPVSCVCAMPEL